MNDQISKQAELYKQQRMIAETAEAESKKQNKILSAIKHKLIDLMGDAGVRKVGTDDDVTLYLKRNIGFSLTEDNMERVREWLIEDQGDDVPFVHEVVSRKTLGELLKHKVEVEEATERDFPDFLKLSLHPNMGVLGWKQAKQQRQENSSDN